MLVVYEGPPDSYDAEVAQALVLGREHTTIELPDDREGAAENATIVATDPASEASGWLEPGRVYDLPPRLANARLETSAWWTKVTKIADLNVEQLTRLARERGVEGRSNATTQKALAKAVSDAEPATLPDPSPPSEAPAGGETSPTPGSTTPAAPPAATTTTPGGNP